ncbi:YegJ family protein [Rhodopirellula baltica]|uniref:DUF2314 domain-containing protein n=1 Tax=Rhodopirellula baltica (strain DSM 10527 / NCIMB 13988 / SH1) TaxID=243090 RepID=Q7UMU9_RHOBA|nr:DUF2314 domain-containing protein [Rhodopirellula baltica]CAD75675.1 conserved hypothetical protein-putative secreted protein [Rhodopirellula baltica SH 1]
MNPRLLTGFVLSTLIAVCGCSESPIADSSVPPVVSIEDDDSEMNAAIAKAQETLSFFENNWKTMDSDGYSLKFAMPTSGGELEHIWFSPIKFEGDEITGECANDPEDIPNLKLGDVRTVTRNDVSDWMIIVGKKCYGGYTIRVLSEREPDVAPPLEFVDPPTN